MDTVDSSVMKKTLQILRPKERDLDLHVTCLVNSCQGKDARVLFKQNFSIHQHTDIEYDTNS